MDYTFTTISKVPDIVKENIVSDFISLLIQTIQREQVNMNNLHVVMLSVKNSMCNITENEVEKYQIEDYTLTPENAQTIFESMTEGRKIDSIRNFRNSTGCSLTEARDLIYHFGCTPNGAQNFLSSLQRSRRNGV
jgi:ribosomal protein L7/L12